MKKLLIKLVLVVFVIFLFTSPVYAGIVPCGLLEDDPDQPGDQTQKCTLCHFFLMLDNLFDFTVKILAPALAALMIAIGGGMYIIGGSGQMGGPDLINQAKSLFIAVAVGLVIVYGAWALVNLLMMLLGYSSGWSVINCTAP